MDKLRARMGALLMAALGACADDSTQTDRDAAASDPACDFTVSLVDYKLVPSVLTASAGEIVLCAKNDGRAPHDLAVRDDSAKVLGRTKVLGPAEQDRFSLELSAGSFDIFCTQGGHESLGMKGKLTVE